MRINRKNFAELFRTDYHTVSVIFVENDGQYSQSAKSWGSGKKAYTYKVPKNMEVSEGDLLLVYVANSSKVIETLKVVRVVSVNREAEIEEDSPFDYKWVVGKLDDVMQEYNRNVEKDTELKRAVHKLEAALEKVSLRKQLAAAMEELDEDDKKELAAAFNLTNLLEHNGGQPKAAKG